MCRGAKQVPELEENDDGVNSLFSRSSQWQSRVNHINTISETNNAWYVELQVNSKKEKFKIDSGAAVSAIPNSVCDALGLKLTPTTRESLSAGSGAKLTVIEVAIVELSHERTRHKEMVYIIEELAKPLLGKAAIKQLGILKVSQVSEVSSTGWKEKFPSLFSGLSTMRSEVHIQLKELLWEKEFYSQKNSGFCLRRAKSMIWWPGMFQDIREMAKRCNTCLFFRKVPTELLIPTPLPKTMVAACNGFRHFWWWRWWVSSY